MPNLKVYLDNCCYNRPYDDQSYINVSLETQAKLYIQDACHIACAELMKCDYFITTDYRVLKYHSETMQIVNPIDFIQILTEGEK